LVLQVIILVGISWDQFLATLATLYINNNTQIPSNQPDHHPLYKIMTFRQTQSENSRCIHTGKMSDNW